MKEQMEKMARDICNLNISCEECMTIQRKMGMDKERYCKALKYAKRAYRKGYRKQSEVIRCKDCEYFKEYTTEYMQRVEKANGDCHLRLINCCLGGENFCGCKYDDFCSLAKRR